MFLIGAQGCFTTIYVTEGSNFVCEEISSRIKLLLLALIKDDLH